MNDKAARRPRTLTEAAEEFATARDDLVAKVRYALKIDVFMRWLTEKLDR